MDHFPEMVSKPIFKIVWSEMWPRVWTTSNTLSTTFLRQFKAEWLFGILWLLHQSFRAVLHLMVSHMATPRKPNIKENVSLSRVLQCREFSLALGRAGYNNDGMAPQSSYNVKLARFFLHKADCIIIRLLVIWVPVRSFTFDVYIMNVYRIFVSTIY